MAIKAMLINLYTRLMKSSFYNPDCSYQLFMLRYDDIFKNKKTTLSQKIWAHQRGFLSDCISFYGLTNNNYKDYLSDFDYFQLQPINGMYSNWIDDKLTIKYILMPYTEFLPQYYYHIHHGGILRLVDCPDSYGQTIQAVINLLKEKRYLAAKLKSGTHGIGFYKLAYDGQEYLINNKSSSEVEISALIYHWMQMGEEYLITEFLQAHRDIRKICNDSPNHLRIMVIREKNLIPKIVFTYIEFGTKRTGIVERTDGIKCKIDLSTGCFTEGKCDTGNKVFDYEYHPDTMVPFQGEIPFWTSIKEKILEISSYIQEVRFMGFDVIVTDNGFKIIEINSHQGIFYIQYYLPLLKEDSSRGFFTSLIHEKRAISKS